MNNFKNNIFNKINIFNNTIHFNILCYSDITTFLFCFLIIFRSLNFKERRKLILLILLISFIIGIITQHQTELLELQCLLHNTQERLQVQVQTTVDQVRMFTITT